MPKKKTRSTWGSLDKVAKNSWRIRYMLCGERQCEIVNGTKAEAERRRAELRLLYEGKERPLTLDQFWTQVYEPEMSNRLAASTIPEYKRTYNKDILPAFGDAVISNIKPREIQGWLSTMTNGKAKACKRILSAILGRALALGYVEDNVAQRRFAYPKEKAKGQRSKAIMQLDVMKSVLVEARNESWIGAFILAAFGGAAREEAVSPMLDEIAWNRGYAVVPIVRGIQRLDKRVQVLDWTKNEYRERVLVIPPPYSSTLKEIVDEKKEAGDVWLSDDGFGHPMDPDVVAKRYTRWFATQPYRYVPFGNLRHSYGTVMETLGIDGMMVSKLLGHSQPATYYKHYFRPSVDDKINAIAEAIDGLS